MLPPPPPPPPPSAPRSFLYSTLKERGEEEEEEKVVRQREHTRADFKRTCSFSSFFYFPSSCWDWTRRKRSNGDAGVAHLVTPFFLQISSSLSFFFLLFLVRFPLLLREGTVSLPVVTVHYSTTALAVVDFSFIRVRLVRLIFFFFFSFLVLTHTPHPFVPLLPSSIAKSVLCVCARVSCAD